MQNDAVHKTPQIGTPSMQENYFKGAFIISLRVIKALVEKVVKIAIKVEWWLMSETMIKQV